jgi:glycosyltransferase involved in cell wall biosynthesis
MAELKKRIVVASVLKPVSDTRMTEKIAASLSHDEHLDIHVIGYPSRYTSKDKITLHSFAPFKRISFKRIFTPFKILRIIRQLNPAVLIVTTHELLGVALLAKLFTRSKMVYDIQENYFLNILHTNAFHRLIKYPVAAYVRAKEIIATRWVDHFFLAEEIYAEQLPFVKGRNTLVLNKANIDFARALQIQKPLALLFSGTLSQGTGVFEAIALAKEFHKIEPEIRLTIIGFAARARDYQAIQAQIQQAPFIRLVGGNSLVNHEEIVQAIASSGAGIVSYVPNPATEGRTPTKLYEYISAGLPILFARPYPQWESVAKQSDHHFFVINSLHRDSFSAIEWLKKAKVRGTTSDSVSWKNEENKLRTAISALL